MDAILNIFSSIGVAVPAILMGALIPCGVLVTLACRKERKEISFISVLHGFGTFFVALAAVAILVLVLSQTLLASVVISTETDADTYIYIGGAIVLVLYYVFSEALKQISFKAAMNKEKHRGVGFAFGSGFILGQNLLIFGLIYSGDVDASQAFVFGLLMLISGVIYLLLSAVGYQMALERHFYAGSAVTIGYFLMFAVMLIFSNVYVTYSYIALLLIFTLVIGYITLLSPLRKKGDQV